MTSPSRRSTVSAGARHTARTARSTDPPRAAVELSREQVLAGRYLLEAELGHGGVGRVFRAYDSATRTRVALKLVRPEIAGKRRWLQRLGREVRHARDVQHPNVCRIFELNEAQGFTFFTMELAAGALTAELDTTARRRLPERVADARGLASGVAAIHAAAIVHRDLKPANVLRMGDGRIVVSDFGLAVLGKRDPGVPEGTWGYMAPEVIQTGAATTRSDVWALGVVMYEILFGARPFLGTRIRRPKGQLSGLEAALAELCLACCSLDPLERPPDARTVSAKLEALDGETLESLLRRGRPAPAEALRLVATSLDALATLHHKKRVHGAICPANVFIGANRALRLLDPAADGAIAQAEPDPVYMAPERARGESGVDVRADIFAAGRVLCECIAGRSEADRGVDALARRALGDKPELEHVPSTIPAPLQKLLSRMLSPEPKKRPRDAGRLAAELRKWAERVEGSAERTATPSLDALSEEQRVICSVAVDLRAEMKTLDARETWKRVRAIAMSFEAVVDELEETAVISVVGPRAPTDLTSIAGRCALALSQQFPLAKVALGIGRAVLTGRRPRGEAIARAVALLDSAEAGKVRIDERTANTLRAHFRIVDGPRPFLAAPTRTVERPRTVLGTDTPCFGRERELATLLGLWDECTSESVARAALVTAPAGVGKTRVRHEFLDRLVERGDRFVLIAGRGDSLRAGAPFALLGPALATAADIPARAPVETQRARLLTFVSRHLAPDTATRLTPIIGEIAGVRFPDDALPALQAARQNPRLMADQVTAAWLELVDTASRTEPVLLIFEDLHWGDAPSLGLVDAALRTSRERPLLVLAFARPEVDTRFPRLWAERDVQRIALPPLTVKSAERLVRHILPSVSPEKVSFLVERADGNPLYLEELVRAFGNDPPPNSEAAPRSRAPGSSSFLPETIAGTVQTRFDALGDSTKRVLRAASIFGEVFSSEGIRAVLASDGVDLDGSLSTLVDREIVYPRGDTGTHEFAFRHALLRQAAYDMLGPRDRVLGHRRAARHLEASGERQAILLVEHFERAGDRRSAARYCRLAAEQALESNDFRSTVSRVERAMSLGPTRADRTRLRVIEARAQRWLGQLAEAERAARAALGGPRGGAWFEAMTELVWIFGTANKLENIAPLARELTREPPRSEDERAWLEALTSAARWLVPAGQVPLAAKLLERVSERADRFTGSLAVRVSLLRGDIARLDGDLSTFVECGRAARAICEATSDLRTLSEVLIELGIAMQELGRLEEAEAALREASEAKTRTGLARSISDANLAYTLCLLGRIPEACALIDRAVAESGPLGTRPRAACEVYSSYIAHRSGDFAKARRAARAAMASSRDWAAAEAQAMALMARALLSLGQRKQALRFARRAEKMLEASSQIEDGEALVRVVLVECLLANGDREAACAALARAKKCVDARAAIIRNPKWRAAFRTRLPENALIERLAREHFTGRDAARDSVSSSSPKRKARARARGGATYSPSNLGRSRART